MFKRLCQFFFFFFFFFFVCMCVCVHFGRVKFALCEKRKKKVAKSVYTMRCGFWLSRGFILWVC